MLGTQEHYDLIDQFEKWYRKCSLTRGRLDKEPKEMWCKGRIYEHGDTRAEYQAFIAGYAYGKTVQRLEAS